MQLAFCNNAQLKREKHFNSHFLLFRVVTFDTTASPTEDKLWHEFCTLTNELPSLTIQVSTLPSE